MTILPHDAKHMQYCCCQNG